MTRPAPACKPPGLRTPTYACGGNGTVSGRKAVGNVQHTAAGHRSAGACSGERLAGVRSEAQERGGGGGLRRHHRCDCGQVAA